MKYLILLLSLLPAQSQAFEVYDTPEPSGPRLELSSGLLCRVIDCHGFNFHITLHDAFAGFKWEF